MYMVRSMQGRWRHAELVLLVAGFGSFDSSICLLFGRLAAVRDRSGLGALREDLLRQRQIQPRPLVGATLVLHTIWHFRLIFASFLPSNVLYRDIDDKQFALRVLFHFQSSIDVGSGRKHTCGTFGSVQGLEVGTT